jgi:pseudouridine synthase
MANNSEGTPAPERGERLNRFLARAGVGSRRRADELIAEGRVAINGIKVTKLATFVDVGTDVVTVNGEKVSPPADVPIWIVLNKSAGTLTTRRDTRGRPTVFDGLPSVYSQLVTVGRLDFDTEGVLLLTNDGDAANRLMHPRYEVERVYEAAVQGEPTPDSLRQLRQGIDLGERTPARAEAQIIGRHRAGVILQLRLHEGRKREIKRLCEAIGHRVVSLKRISYAGIKATRLSVGHWRKLSPGEVEFLRAKIRAKQ